MRYVAGFVMWRGFEKSPSLQGKNAWARHIIISLKSMEKSHRLSLSTTTTLG